MMHDDGQCEHVWHFVDNMDVCDPNMKSTNMNKIDVELAVELNHTLLVMLEQLTDT